MNNLKDLIEIYKTHYFNELELKFRFEQNINILIGLSSATVLVTLYAMNELEFDFFNSFIKSHISLLLLLATTVSFLIGVYNLVRCCIGYSYGHLPYLNNLQTYYNNLVSYYIQINVPSPQDQANQEFSVFLANYYAECASINASNNAKKSVYYHNSNKYIGFSLIFALIFASIIACSKIDYKENSMSNQQPPQTQTQPQAPQTQPQAPQTQPQTPQTQPQAPQIQPQPVKPTPPSIRMIKENQIPKE